MTKAQMMMVLMAMAFVSEVVKVFQSCGSIPFYQESLVLGFTVC